MRNVVVWMFAAGVVVCADFARATGALDTSFGVGGVATVATTPYGGSHPVAPLADGSIAGIVGSSPLKQLYHVSAEGVLDPSFGTGGLVDLASVGSQNEDWGAVMGDASGRILLSGGTSTGAWEVLRLLPDGTTDASFGTGGTAVIDPSPGLDAAPAIFLQPDQKIVLTGQVGFHPAVARLNADGSVDAGFGAGGVVVRNYGGTFELFVRPNFQSDGKVVLGVYSFGGSASGAFAATRLNADGTTDAAFGTTSPGLTRVSMPKGGTGGAATLDAVGRILITGLDAYAIADRDFTIVRLLGDGSLDPSFGTGGISSVDFTGLADESNVVLVQPDGKLLVVGQVARNGTEHIAVARFNDDGSLDTGFGVGGLVVTLVDSFSQPTSEHLLGDGDLLIAGSSFPGDVRNFLLRIMPCGPCDLLTANGCVAPPPAGCSAAASARLILKHKGDANRDRVSFAHRKGPGASVADFGSPTEGDALRFCVVRSTPGGEQPKLRAYLGSLGDPTWTAKPRGFTLKDPLGTHDGMTKVLLTAGTSASVKVKGQGSRLRMPTLPLGPSPIHARVQAATGACWDALLPIPSTDDGIVYKAKIP